MTNFYENLDAILLQIRQAYLSAFTREDYLTATNFLFTMNSAHPPEAKLNDMPRFRIRANLTPHEVDYKAQRYCLYWFPLLEESMSQFRLKNLEAYSQL